MLRLSSYVGTTTDKRFLSFCLSVIGNSSDEKKYLNVILDRYSEDDKELLKLRTQFLDSILDRGIDEVKSFVIKLSKSLKNKIDDDMKSAYLGLFKEVIMLDKNVHENERILYRLLCEQWDQKSDI